MAKSPKPTKVLQLEGTWRKDRHESRAGEVEPTPGFPDAPEWLDSEALAEWKRIESDSAYREAICLLDRAVLAAYCCMWSRFVRGEKTGSHPVRPAHIAVMLTLGAKLGLNPVDRVKVKTRAPKPAINPWQKLKNGSTV